MRMTWKISMNRLLATGWLAIAGALVFANSAWAQEAESTLDSGDTAWILTSSAVVLLMTPALALFYAGMARSKNVLGTMMHSVFLMGLISVQWAVIGYTLAFGSDIGSFITC